MIERDPKYEAEIEAEAKSIVRIADIAIAVLVFFVACVGIAVTAFLALLLIWGGV